VIGKNILKIRKSKGLTQEEVAAKARIDRSTLSDIERGKVRDLGFYKVMAIAKALKVSAEDLMGLKARGRFVPLPIISKAVASPEGAYYTDQDFPAGAGEDYYEVEDPNAFVIRVEGTSMEPTIREGDLIVVTPEKAPKNGEIAIVRLAGSGKTFLKRVEIHGSDVILKSENQRFETLVHKRKEIDWMYRVEAIVPR
jgi:SOS-response transcriptional repressor LexA